MCLRRGTEHSRLVVVAAPAAREALAELLEAAAAEAEAEAEGGEWGDEDGGAAFGGAGGAPLVRADEACFLLESSHPRHLYGRRPPAGAASAVAGASPARTAAPAGPPLHRLFARVDVEGARVALQVAELDHPWP